MDILNKPHKNHKKPFKLLCGKLISFSGDYSRQKDYKFTSQQSWKCSFPNFLCTRLFVSPNFLPNDGLCDNLIHHCAHAELGWLFHSGALPATFFASTLVVAKFQPIYNQIYDTKKESILNTETLLDSVTTTCRSRSSFTVTMSELPLFVYIKRHVTLMWKMTIYRCDQSQHSFGRSICQRYWWYFGTEHCFFGSEVAVSLKFTPLSTQTRTCWELATCVCVFSRPHSPLMTDLSVRYLLKNYILLECAWTWLQGVKTAKLGKTSFSKLTFVSPK